MYGLQIKAPYEQVVLIERYLCADSVVIVFTTETGHWWAVMTPYN